MKTFPIADISNRITSGGTPSRKREDFYQPKPLGHRWVKSKELLDSSISETEEHISDLGLKHSSAKYLEAGTVLVGMYGANVGQLGWLRNPATVNQAVCGLTADPSRADYRWLFYALMHHRPRLVAMAQGAAQQNISAQLIKSFEIPLPSLATQQRIAAILTAYDDLIENNTRRIAILEEMARRLYEEWFVHFRFPGHDEMEFRETDRGQVPQGWNWVPLSKMYETSAGGTPSRKKPEFYGGSVRWVKSKELRDAPIFGTEEMITEEGLRKSSAKLFPQTSVLIAMYGATIGQLGVLRAEAATNQAVCAVLPAREAHGWAYAFLSILARRSELIDLRAGAAQQNVSQAIIKRFPMLHADHETHSLFEAAVKPLLGLSFALHRKNANLRAQRDLLLPKLVSGEIDVSQTEATLEAAE